MNLPAFLKKATGFTAAVGGPTRSDTWLIQVHVQDVTTGNMIPLGTFDKRTGGEKTSSSITYRPGGMAPPVALGGVATTANVVVSRLYRLERDHQRLQMLLNGVGRASMVVTEHPLQLDTTPFGNPVVWRGILDGVKSPEPDSEATTTAALLELTMVVSGFPTA